MFVIFMYSMLSLYILLLTRASKSEDSPVAGHKQLLKANTYTSVTVSLNTA